MHVIAAKAVALKIAASEAFRERLRVFDLAAAALGLYDFVYGELCDWYLELVKPRLYDEGYEGRADLSSTLLHVLRETLALAHPVIPFVTEEIHSRLPGVEGLLAAGPLSPPDPARRDPEAEREVGDAIAAIGALRAWRDSVGVPAGARIPARLAAEGYERTAGQLARLARLDLDGGSGEPVATVSVPGGTVGVLGSDAVGEGAAAERLAARRATLEAEIERASRKLANEGFVAKAPAEVVEAERAKLARLTEELEAL